MERFSIEMRIANRFRGAIDLRRAEVFFASRGGFAMSAEEQIANRHSFYGIGPRLDGSSQDVIHGLHSWFTPVTHVVYAFDVKDQRGAFHHSTAQIPITRPGYRAPERLPSGLPFFVALQEPIEVLPLTAGDLWLPIIGQVVDFSAKPLTLERWRFRVDDDAGKRLVELDLLKSFAVKDDSRSLIEFLYTFTLESRVAKGKLTIDALAVIDGERHSLIREAEITTAEPAILHPPTKGLWSYENGPGAVELHTHLRHPEQRYAYDLLMRNDVAGSRRTFKGDPEKNESYFAWHQPIFAVADGTVIAVVDDVPDNFGNKPNPANKDGRNSWVVVEHSGRKYSLYSHVSQGTATVKLGQRVKAGEILGRLGNAGQSTEPHLHFQYSELDATGHQRALPVRFIGLKSREGRPLDGVPRGRRGVSDRLNLQRPTRKSLRGKAVTL